MSINSVNLKQIPEKILANSTNKEKQTIINTINNQKSKISQNSDENFRISIVTVLSSYQEADESEEEVSLNSQKCDKDFDESNDELTLHLKEKKASEDIITRASSHKKQNFSSEILSSLKMNIPSDLTNEYPKLKEFLPSPETYRKVSRKEASIPNPIGIKEGLGIFVHNKTPLGKGCSKIAFAADLITLSGETKPVIYKKLLTNSSKAFTRKEVKKAQREIKKAAEEAKLQSNFNHESIVKLLSFDVHSDGTKVAIYEEACEGNLESAVLTEQEELNVSIDVAKALDYLHEQGYAHNDIKLNNIFVKKGRGKLGDFGNTAVMGSRVLGYTKNYAPEQQGERVFGNEKTDVYQFGLCLWNLFHPQPLTFASEYPSKKGAVEEMFVGWDDDSAIKELVRQCLDPNPQLRPNMKTVVNSLKTIQAINS